MCVVDRDLLLSAKLRNSRRYCEYLQRRRLLEAADADADADADGAEICAGAPWGWA